MLNKNKIALTFSAVFLFNSFSKCAETSSVQKLVIDDSPAAWLFKAGEFYLEVRKPAEGINHVLKTSKDGSFLVEEENIWNYALHKKTTNRFVPERIVGKACAKVFKAVHMLPSDYNYKGSPIMDEYSKGIPFRMSFANVDELQKVLTYLKSKFVSKIYDENPYTGQTLPATKSVLLLEIDNKAMTIEEINQTNLINKADVDFIQANFTLPTENELLDLRKFFGESRTNFRDTIRDTEDHPGMKFKTMREYIYNDVMKKCKDFKSEQIIPSMIEGAALAVTLVIMAKLLNMPQSSYDSKNLEKLISKLTSEALAKNVNQALFAKKNI